MRNSSISSFITQVLPIIADPHLVRADEQRIAFSSSFSVCNASASLRAWPNARSDVDINYRRTIKDRIITDNCSFAICEHF